MDYLLDAPLESGHVMFQVEPYTETLVCRFTLQSAVPDGVRNGFLMLRNSNDPDTEFYAGVYIGMKAFAIEGPGVTEHIVVNLDFDQAKVFELTVLVDLKQGFIELIAPERTIGTGLRPHVYADISSLRCECSGRQQYSDVLVSQVDSTGIREQGMYS